MDWNSPHAPGHRPRSPFAVPAAPAALAQQAPATPAPAPASASETAPATLREITVQGSAIRDDFNPAGSQLEAAR
jgi:catecholate siderophore receptor